MERVIKSPNLFVMQIEVDIYNLAKTWMFLKLDSSWEGVKKDLLPDANAYFQARVGDRAFLETDEGSKYTCVFQGVRLHHVICDVKAVRQLDQDRIIPNGEDFYANKSKTILKLGYKEPCSCVNKTVVEKIVDV
jgi:BTB/POZ domain-containing protein 13